MVEPRLGSEEERIGDGGARRNKRIEGKELKGWAEIAEKYMPYFLVDLAAPPRSDGLRKEEEEEERLN